VDKPVDKIMLTGLEFHAFHGAFSVEGELGGRFVIDLEMQLDLTGIKDHLERTVSYAEVFQTVKLEVTEKKYNLIETLAENIAKQVLLEHPKLGTVLVRVHKPFAPIPGIFKDVAVEVTRTRI
jgi:dihydroneopterin aldolase